MTAHVCFKFTAQYMSETSSYDSGLEWKVVTKHLGCKYFQPLLLQWMQSLSKSHPYYIYIIFEPFVGSCQMAPLLGFKVQASNLTTILAQKDPPTNRNILLGWYNFVKTYLSCSVVVFCFCCYWCTGYFLSQKPTTFKVWSKSGL